MPKIDFSDIDDYVLIEELEDRGYAVNNYDLKQEVQKFCEDMMKAQALSETNFEILHKFVYQHSGRIL